MCHEVDESFSPPRLVPVVPVLSFLHHREVALAVVFEDHDLVPRLAGQVLGVNEDVLTHLRRMRTNTQIITIDRPSRNPMKKFKYFKSNKPYSCIVKLLSGGDIVAH